MLLIIHRLKATAIDKIKKNIRNLAMGVLLSSRLPNYKGDITINYVAVCSSTSCSYKYIY